MNQRILLTKSWSSFTFDEKINTINALNVQRMRERDPRSLRKEQRAKNTKTRVKREKKPQLSSKAASLFDMLPDEMKKGLL